MDKDSRIVKFIKAIKAVGLDPKDPRVVSIVEEILLEGPEKLDETEYRYDSRNRLWRENEHVWFYGNSKVIKGSIRAFIGAGCEIETKGGSVHAVRLEDLHLYDYEPSRGRFSFGDKVFLSDPVENQYTEYFIIGFAKGKDYAFLFKDGDLKTHWMEIDNLRHV
jgi:hypothetical protein